MSGLFAQYGHRRYQKNLPVVEYKGHSVICQIVASDVANRLHNIAAYLEYGWWTDEEQYHEDLTQIKKSFIDELAKILGEDKSAFENASVKDLLQKYQQLADDLYMKCKNIDQAEQLERLVPLIMRLRKVVDVQDYLIFSGDAEIFETDPTLNSELFELEQEKRQFAESEEARHSYFEDVNRRAQAREV